MEGAEDRAWTLHGGGGVCAVAEGVRGRLCVCGGGDYGDGGVTGRGWFLGLWESEAFASLFLFRDGEEGGSVSSSFVYFEIAPRSLHCAFRKGRGMLRSG